jgi:acetyltransferase-like isoleucine patch superfamily enzyme
MTISRALFGEVTVGVHPSVRLGRNVRIVNADLLNIYGCEIGAQIGPFVEIQRGASVGTRCGIQSHNFVCQGVTIEDGVFVGHDVMFTNDPWPRATNDDHASLLEDEWVLSKTLVKTRASMGNGATILPVTIGEGALVAAWAVVTRDVPARGIVAGNPARVVGDVRERRPRAVQSTGRR